ADAADEKGNGGNRNHDGIEQALGAALLGQQFSGHDHAEIAGRVMAPVQNRADRLSYLRDVGAVIQVQIYAVDFIADIAVAVFEAQNGSAQRNVNNVIQVLSWNPGNLGLRTKLRTGNTSDLKPLLIQFHVLAEGISGAEQVRLGASTEDADGSGM